MHWSEKPPTTPDAVAAVLAGYREGAFLMAIDPQHAPRAAWYASDPRGVIRLDPPGWHVPRRLRRTARSGRFAITGDKAFGAVVRACGDPRRDGGWINDGIMAVFEMLHEAGHAHSVEAWLPLCREVDRAASSDPGVADLIDRDHTRVLVAGLYGVCVGGVFCAESMFSRPDLGGRDASKVCLVRTIEHLHARGFALLDTQMCSDHLSRFGCEAIPREEYLEILGAQRDRDCGWGRFGEAGPTASGS